MVMPVAIAGLKPLIVLASLALTLAMLSWLRPIFIPFALAILLTFMSSPIVSLLERRGLWRVPAVVMVTLGIFLTLGGIGWVVARQVNSLIDTYPQYEYNLSQKITSFQANDGGFVDKLRIIAARITRQIENRPAPAADGAAKVDPLPVKIVADDRFSLSSIWSVLGPVLAPFATVGLAAVLVLFMLINREDLRDRIICVIGPGRLTHTTKALDDAGLRISRYLLVQLLINSGYGIAAGLGIYLIGVPYALLWGFLAALFRYIPYLGPWIAALLPISLSLLVSQGWTMPLMVVGLFITLELLCNMVMEPWLYGRGVGVSATATLVMIAFWTWLWGPIGLILATPLTVCLVVAGRYVPALSFFDTLLGDQPPLETAIGYYQRLLAHDQDEASVIAEDHLKKTSLEETYGTLVLPALINAEHDFNDGNLDGTDLRFVLDATREIVEELAALGVGATVEDSSSNLASAAILCCPARDETDEVALLMLGHLLDRNRYTLTVASRTLLAAEVVALVEETNPALFLISAPPPGGQSHTRLLLVRLRTRFPDLKIVVGRWGLNQDVDQKRTQLLNAGADAFGVTFEETRRQIKSLAHLAVAAPAPAPAFIAVGA